jgi:hypothetical protein
LDWGLPFLTYRKYFIESIFCVKTQPSIGGSWFFHIKFKKLIDGIQGFKPQKMKFLPKYMNSKVSPSGRFAISIRGFIMLQDVNLFNTPSNNLGLQSRLNNPLYNNYHIVANFAMVVVSILFLLYSFQIYNKMQMGESRLIPMMTRFFLGLVVFLGMLSFLNRFAQKQDYNDNSLQNLTMPKLSK